MAHDLDYEQVITNIYDQVNNRIRVDSALTLSTVSQEVIISHTDDSISLGDGTNLITATVVGPDVGLDVNVVGGVVSGTFSFSGLSTDLRTQAITVTDSPTKIPTTALANRNSISVRVWGSSTVYFGDTSVDVSNGYPKLYSEEIILDIKDNASVELWAVCDTGQSCEVRIMEVA